MYFNLVKVGSNVCYSNYSSCINRFCTVELVSDLEDQIVVCMPYDIACQGHSRCHCGEFHGVSV